MHHDCVGRSGVELHESVRSFNARKTKRLRSTGERETCEGTIWVFGVRLFLTAPCPAAKPGLFGTAMFGMLSYTREDRTPMYFIKKLTRVA